MEKRPVKILDVKNPKTGYFLGWGIDHDEYAENSLHQTVAIVEDEEGFVSLHFVSDIQFTDH